MKQHGSYDVSSFSTSSKAEIQRLNAQVDLFWPMEYALLQKYGLREEMNVLDCGCGPGRLIELLKGQMPGLNITGVEMDRHLVEAASHMISENRLSNCTIFEGTAEKPGITDVKFDFIIMRLVLEHVPDPVLALRSLTDLLRTEGRIMVISNDFDFHLRTWPPVPELDSLYEAYCASRIKDGGDPCIGRRVPQLMLQAGLNLVGNEIELAHNTLLGDKPFLKAEGAGIPAQLVHTGFLDAEILNKMTHSWREMLSASDHSIIRPLFVAVGEKTKEALKPISDEKMHGKSKGIKSEIPFKTTAKEVEEKTGGTLVIILKFLAEALKEKMEESGKDVINPTDPLVDMGLDSLLALDLQERIEGVTGIEIPLEKLLENLSAKSLAEYLDVQMAGREIKLKEKGIQQGQQQSESWEEGEI